MRYQHKHRILEPLNTSQEKGQIIHFLTGYGIRDNYLYDIYYGILGLEDTLKRYYLLDADSRFDYFIHVISASNEKCYQAQDNDIVEISFEEMFPEPKSKSVLKLKKNKDSSPKKEEIQNQADDVRQTANNEEIQNQAEGAKKAALEHKIDKLKDYLKSGSKRFLLFIENMEWVSKLYDTPIDSSWIATLQSLTKMRNLMVVVTISDFELLKQYNFEQKDTFIGYPSAEEIKYSYLRYLLRSTTEEYAFDMKVLDDVAHSMSVGKKSLISCMRILRKILKINSKQLLEEDFKDCAEINIEEKVLWENVRLPQEKKIEIMGAINKFLTEDASKSRKGILLTGPPGTGKTMIAKALANEARCYFMAPKLADMKGEYVGQSSAKVKRIFSEARANSPTIMFIDEADTVFPSRSIHANDKDSFTLDIVNQSLQEIDGADTGEQKIFVIAATNRPEVIDSAIRSRLSQTPIEIPLPARRERQLMFDDGLSKQHKGFSIRGKSYEELMLSRSDGMSGRDIANFTKKILEKNIPLYDNEKAYEIFQEGFLTLEDSVITDMTGSEGVFAKDSICAPEDNTSNMDDIIGYDELKESIRQQAKYIKATAEEKQEYSVFDIPVPRGILMYGPPGNGKTELAKAAAGELGFYFFKVISRDFASSSSEIQIKRLEQIFQDTIRFSKLMTKAPGIVLFFDEIDALAGTMVLNQVVRGSLLNFLGDKSLRDKDSKILLIAATNHEDLLDEAVKRKGRIDVHYLMDNPTEENGELMLKSFFERDCKVNVTEDDIIKKLYERALNDKRNSFIVSHFGTLEWRDTIREEKDVVIAEKLINKQRPSGSDLRTLYGEMKSIAFHNHSIKDNKLSIGDAEVDMRFPANI